MNVGRRFNAMALLLVCAVVPALGLAGLWKWADSRRIPAARDATVVEGPQAEPLITPVLSLRRAPLALAASTNDNLLATALAPVADMVGDTSCLTVEVDGRRVLDDGGATQVTPASNLKLLVASVALETLGADYTFATQLKGSVSGGTVVGDLYFVGGGDPLLSTADYPSKQKYPTTNPTSVESLVAKLSAAGVTSIEGNVVGDDSRYDAERFVPTWGPAISGIEAGPLSALMVNDATSSVVPGSTARYANPALGATKDLIRVLQKAGITVGGAAKTATAPPEAGVLAVEQSVPLSAVLGEMLTTSDDNTAELLLKELGVHAGTRGTRQAGNAVVLATLEARGMDTSAISLVDGSGLDSANLVTCNVIMRILDHESVTNPIGVGLPIAGRTGTLTTQFLGTDMVGRMHAKTGSLRNAKALSGYVTSTGGTITFSMILDFANASDTSKYEPIWAALATALGTYPAGPTPEQLQPL